MSSLCAFLAGVGRRMAAQPTFNYSFIVDGDERQLFTSRTSDAFKDRGICDARPSHAETKSTPSLIHRAEFRKFSGFAKKFRWRRQLSSRALKDDTCRGQRSLAVAVIDQPPLC